MSIPKDPKLLDRLRKRLLAGDSIGSAAERCGVGKKVAEGLIRRHGRGEPRKLVPPPPPLALTGCARDGGCNWIASPGRPWLFCQAAHLPGLPYCREHQARAVVPHRPRLDRPYVLPRLGVAL